MTIPEFRALLDERLLTERQDLFDSKKIAPNSYGAGYDQGFVDALETILRTLNGEEENTL